MKELKYIIKDELGLHARPAGLLIKTISDFKCDIRIGKGERLVNAKGIMGVMSLGFRKGDEIKMIFDGQDENLAFIAVENFLKNNL